MELGALLNNVLIRNAFILFELPVYTLTFGDSLIALTNP
jgi:hypothetical protein